MILRNIMSLNEDTVSTGGTLNQRNHTVVLFKQIEMDYYENKSADLSFYIRYM